jgi:phosphoribosylamine--glycine ligase
VKVLILDVEGEGTGLDLALRAQDAGHMVGYWLPSPQGTQLPYGKGMIARPKEWEGSMDWAELIVLTGNSKYGDKLAPYFGKGYPIFGANEKSAALELDRAKGQEVLAECGIETIPYKVVDTAEEGIKHICKTDCGYAMKQWGGAADKSMTCVAKTPDDAIFTLEKWEREGKLKGKLMLQELVEGVEIGISGFFGPGGWSAALEESFEFKRFLNGDLGENTGEMGTVIRHVTKSKLFDMVLDPLTDYLHMLNYVGDCNVNCIVDRKGRPWPLEFTMRLGWPDFCIRQALIEGDPVEWMYDLTQGQDTLTVSSEIAVGVVLAHGDFPSGKDPQGTWVGYPIRGVSRDVEPNIHLQQVMVGEYPMLGGGKVKSIEGLVTAGNYVGVASGTGRTVLAAHKASLAVVERVLMPSNVMYRTDIGERLEEELPLLQRHGFAEGMKYG